MPVSKRRIGQWLNTLGWDPRKLGNAIREWRMVSREKAEYLRQERQRGIAPDFPLTTRYLAFGERGESAGEASGHYFHQDLLVAREIHRRNPDRHIDVGSRVDGFVAHVASFRTIEVLDVRPLQPVDGIRFIQADMMNLDPELIESADSVSCLHALEHFGLGRYGDPVDYDGWRRGLESLTRMLTPGGRLYLSVPTGEHQRVEFNSHRIFALPFLRDYLLRDFTIDRLAFIRDSGDLVPDVDPFGREAQRSFSAVYGCSVWFLTKRL